MHYVALALTLTLTPHPHPNPYPNPYPNTQPSPDPNPHPSQARALRGRDGGAGPPHRRQEDGRPPAQGAVPPRGGVALSAVTCHK